MHKRSKTGFIHFCDSRVEQDESPSTVRLHEGGQRPSARSARCFERIQLASFRISMVFLIALAIGLPSVASAQATRYATRLLYSFTSGSDASNPGGGTLVTDANGNLFGTTFGGGTSARGAVFELAKSATGTYSETVLYSFTGGADGGLPVGGLVIDAAGNLYGTTQNGGANGLGTVFELVNSSGTYTETVLHSFAGGTADGQVPNGGLVRDAAGNLYGTTFNANCFCGDNGTVFELVNSSGTYTEKVLYQFTGTGANFEDRAPVGPLVVDASGNLYGATTGSSNGMVFELVNSSGTYSETVLYIFKGMPDGQAPNGGLIRDSVGNLYGTTLAGGNDGNCNTRFGVGCGTVFELVNSSGTYSETILHSFTIGSDNVAAPNGGLVRDAAGNFFGTGGGGVEGTVFELVKSSAAYTVKVLHSFFFSCASDGEVPQAGLLMDAAGNLYGTTNGGGASGQGGTVFELVLFTGQAATTKTNLTSSLNPATAGDPVTLTATVTASGNSGFLLSGRITILNGSLAVASAPLQCGGTTSGPDGPGLVIEDADALGVGVNTLTATFTPDTAAFAASSGTLQQTVNEPGVVLTNGNNNFNGNQTVNGTITASSLISGSLAVGGGTPIQEYTSVTDAVTLPMLIPFSCSEFTTAPLTGFTPGTSDTIALGTPRSLLSGLGSGVFLFYQAWETTTTTSPTVTIQVCNPSARFYGGGATGTIRVSIFKH